jgi:hypothetical protein
LSVLILRRASHHIRTSIDRPRDFLRCFIG